MFMIVSKLQVASYFHCVLQGNWQQAHTTPLAIHRDQGCKNIFTPSQRKEAGEITSTYVSPLRR